jgi:outer membrane protein OmpA-like peptidoglycan-associated protein
MAALLSIAALSAAAPRSDAQAPAAAAPEVMQQREIERALSAPRTRGLRISPRQEPAVPDEPSKPAEPATGPATAGAGSTVTGGTAQPQPAAASVALDIPFEINSSTLRPAAARQISQLAGALGSEALAGYRFLIAGHTDGTGDAAYNRKLSARRADAVRRRLIDAGVAAERLDARGFGEDELLDPAHPNAAANRRVEIRNLGVAAH